MNKKETKDKEMSLRVMTRIQVMENNAKETARWFHYQE
jgi:hypothetical protein